MEQEKNKRVESVSISLTMSLLEALRQMEKAKTRLLMVFDNGRFQGMLSSGDIQRALISGGKLDDAINAYYRRRNTLAFKGDNFLEIRNKMLAGKIEFMPVLDADDNIADVIFWDELFPAGQRFETGLPEDCSALIVAGGKGTRLAPVTHVIPKPLLLLGDRPVIQHIVESLYRQGVKSFYISVYHQAELIKSFFNSLEPLPYKVTFIDEREQLGTGGSVFNLPLWDTAGFVSNADIILDYPLADIHNFHLAGSFDLTIVAAMVETEIPYGIVESDENGNFISMAEKPSHTHKVNTGFYIVNPSVQGLAAPGTFLDFNQLIIMAKERGLRIGVFSIPGSNWIDMGNWKDYKEAQRRFLN